MLAVSRARTQAYAGRHQQQHEQRVGVVEAEHEHGDRGEGQDGPGQQAGRRAEPPAHGRVQHADRRDAASACGTRIDHELNPNSRTDSAISHSEAGVLSTVMELPASEEPKKNAFQLCDPACTAAE